MQHPEHCGAEVAAMGCRILAETERCYIPISGERQETGLGNFPSPAFLFSVLILSIPVYANLYPPIPLCPSIPIYAHLCPLYPIYTQSIPNLYSFMPIYTHLCPSVTRKQDDLPCKVRGLFSQLYCFMIASASSYLDSNSALPSSFLAPIPAVLL